MHVTRNEQRETKVSASRWAQLRTEGNLGSLRNLPFLWLPAAAYFDEIARLSGIRPSASEMMTSTRRFCCRPALLPLLATG